MSGAKCKYTIIIVRAAKHEVSFRGIYRAQELC